MYETSETDTASETLRQLRIRAQYAAMARETAEEKARRTPEQVREAAVQEWIYLLDESVILRHLTTDDLHICARCGAIGVDYTNVAWSGRYECETCHPRGRR